MRKWHVVLGLAPFMAGCAEGPSSPETALSADRVEQMLEVRASTQDGVGYFTITSTLHNRGDHPQTLRVRSCYLRDVDLRGERPGLRVHEPLMLCASGSHEITLAAGEASESIEINGEMAPDATYDLDVRHALAPERWAPVTVKAP